MRRRVSPREYGLTIILLHVPFFSLLSSLLKKQWAAIPSLDVREARGVHPLSYSYVLFSPLFPDRLEDGGMVILWLLLECQEGGRGHAVPSSRKAGGGHPFSYLKRQGWSLSLIGLL